MVAVATVMAVEIKGARKYSGSVAAVEVAEAGDEVEGAVEGALEVIVAANGKRCGVGGCAFLNDEYPKVSLGFSYFFSSFIARSKTGREKEEEEKKDEDEVEMEDYLGGGEAGFMLRFLLVTPFSDFMYMILSGSPSNNNVDLSAVSTTTTTTAIIATATAT